MTILRLKNPTNIYDAKKTRRGARIPCSRRSTDQIKVFKVQYADSWGMVKWGEKKPEREEKEEEERSGMKVGPGLNGRELGASHSGTELGVKIYGAKLDARVTGAELPAMSPSMSASSPGARCQGRWRQDMLARRQHRWRRVKGPDSEIFPPGVYLWKNFKKNG